MDLDEVRNDLEEHFPMWSDRIRLLRFQGAAGVNLVDNNGSVVFYNPERINRIFAGLSARG